MKNIIFNYIVSSAAIALVLAMLSDDEGCVLGIALGSILLISVKIAPKWWRTFYMTNVRVLVYFGLL